MKILKLSLYTNTLEEERRFYTQTLGFPQISKTNDSFTVQIGWSELSFRKSPLKHLYHYCFLIPSNMLDSALAWMEKRTAIIPIDKDKKTQWFDTWNAESFYFNDASGNIAEFIVRYDLKNNIKDFFDNTCVLGINEIGMPVEDIKSANQLLEAELNTHFWKGDYTRFGTNGSEEGLILLPNYKTKNDWFPTGQLIKQEPFSMAIENNQEHVALEFANGEIMIFE